MGFFGEFHSFKFREYFLHAHEVFNKRTSSSNRVTQQQNSIDKNCIWGKGKAVKEIIVSIPRRVSFLKHRFTLSASGSLFKKFSLCICSHTEQQPRKSHLYIYTHNWHIAPRNGTLLFCTPLTVFDIHSFFAGPPRTAADTKKQTVN